MSYSRIARPALNSFFVENLFLPPTGAPLRCQSNVTECQDKHRLKHYHFTIDLFSLLERSLPLRRLVRGIVKIIAKAKYIKSGETVLDRGIRFIIKEVRVRTNDGGIMFIDMEGVQHGVYHPDEYLGVGQELAQKYAATYDWQTVAEAYELANMPSKMIH
jgi:hypothetical protein